MRIRYKASFTRDLIRLKDAGLVLRVQQAVETVEQAEKLHDIPNLIKMQGGGDYYRLRVGEYRLGISMLDNVAVFVRCLNRKDIYKRFP
jgi:mRNA interferase RelE/StbE